MGLVFLFTGQTYATEVLNGSFEQYHPDPCGHEYYYSSMWSLGRPNDWADANEAWVLTKYIPEEGETLISGHAGNWQVEQLDPADGNSFLLLDTDERDRSHPPDANNTYTKSYVIQRIDFNDGDRLSGQWFFGTYDYPHYSDYGRISLIPVGDSGETIELLDGVEPNQFGVDDVGRYSSTAGWQRFEYTFDANTAGTYDLKLFITDVQDSIYPSVMAVDNISVCSNSSQADVNFDCKVDMYDLSIIAAHWMKSCDEDDPDCYKADIDSSGMVESGDLQQLALDWLEGS